MADTEFLLIFGSILLLVLVWAIYGFLNAFRSRVHRHAMEMEAAERQKANDLLQASVRSKEQTLEFVSWELHDNICQVVAMSGTLLLDAVEIDDVAEKNRLLESTAEQLFTTTKELRNIATSLNSKQILKIGLVGFIEKEVAFITSLHSRKILCEFYHEDRLPERLPSHKILLLCRIVQEAMMNIIKHSEADLVYIHLSLFNGELNLAISDNGKGFQVDENAPGKMGIINMRERAELLGARLIIESGMRNGSRIIIKLGLKPEEL